jgi:hypothetical protein
MGASTDLYDLCDVVLQVAADSLDTIPTDDPQLVGAPTRQFVAPGLPEVECCGRGNGIAVQGQLSVHNQTLQEEGTNPLSPPLAVSQRPGKTGRVVSSTIVIMIARCSPTGNMRTPPTVAQWQLSARQTNADAWAIWNGIWRAQRDYDAFAPWCDGVFFDPSSSLPPQGGCVGTVFVLRPVMQGYNPLPGDWVPDES